MKARAPLAAPADPLLGQVLAGKYRIDACVASGGFATVYRATQLHGTTELGKVALKRLHPRLARDPGVARRFINEARAARELGSPHVVRIFDLGVADGIPFMVQEFVEGVGLFELAHREGPMPADRALKIGLQVAEAMLEAHGKGILHRDLKPENLLVQQTAQGDFVKVLDFGIARLSAVGSAATSSLIGTPRYMSPEQIRQRPLDGRADVFALGVILFELLAGRPPIRVAQEEDYLVQNLLAAPTELTALRPDLPASVAALVMRMMAKERDARPADMAEVMSALREASAPPPTTAAAPEVPDAALAPTARPIPPTRHTPPTRIQAVTPSRVPSEGPPAPRATRGTRWIVACIAVALLGASLFATLLALRVTPAPSAPPSLTRPLATAGKAAVKGPAPAAPLSPLEIAVEPSAPMPPSPPVPPEGPAAVAPLGAPVGPAPAADGLVRRRSPRLRFVQGAGGAAVTTEYEP